MDFKLWLENENLSCLKGEYIYYSFNKKLQNAIRSDRHRGHFELISNFYIQKNKKGLIEAWNSLEKDSRVNKEKLKSAFKEIRSVFRVRYFGIPPESKTDISNDTFELYWTNFFDIIYSDIYEDSSRSISHEEVESYFKQDYGVLNHISYHRNENDIYLHAMLNYKIIFVRSDVHFDIDEFDKKRLRSCIEAICKNKIDPSSYNTTIYINTFSASGTKNTLTTTVGDLFSDELPQVIQGTEVKGSGLKVDPFSKAGIAARDIDREFWRHRTSESMEF
jgi:hypothetical protein